MYSSVDKKDLGTRFSEMWLKASLKYANDRDYFKALKAVEKSFIHDKENIDGFIIRSLIYVLLECYYLSIHDLETALKMNASHKVVIKLLASAWVKQLQRFLDEKKPHSAMRCIKKIFFHENYRKNEKLQDLFLSLEAYLMSLTGSEIEDDLSDDIAMNMTKELNILKQSNEMSEVFLPENISEYSELHIDADDIEEIFSGILSEYPLKLSDDLSEYPLKLPDDLKTR